MSWQCIELITSADKEEFFSELFDEFDALSVTTTGADETQVFEVEGQANDNWRIIKITGMFDARTNLEPLLSQLSVHKNVEISKKPLRDRDWQQAWLENYKPQKINDKLWICPSWLTPVDPNATTITIDPGMSFGTGTHQSTRLCLAWLSELTLDQATVIDYGCGTGILAIAAVKLGAKNALATDIEPRSLAASLENASKNDVSQAVKTYLPDEMPDIKAEVVIANILAGTIIDLSEVLFKHTKPHGRLLLAGLLRTQEESIKAAFNGINWQSRYEDNWVALLGERKY